MTSHSIDPNPYLNIPRVGVRAGLSLGRMLLSAIPEDPTPNVLAAAQFLSAAVDELATRWAAKLERRSTDARVQDRQLDHTWAALQTSLARYEVLPPDHPDRERAAQLHARLFPAGLAFLKLPYLEQHAESNLRLEWVETEDLRDDLDRLAGAMFVEALLAAHEAYGEVLGITETSDQTPPSSLVDPLRALTRAIARYALQLLAYADIDPEHIPVVRRALAPIDEVRRGNARRRPSRDTESTGDDDVPIAESSTDMPESTDSVDTDITSSAA